MGRKVGRVMHKKQTHLTEHAALCEHRFPFLLRLQMTLCEYIYCMLAKCVSLYARLNLYSKHLKLFYGLQGGGRFVPLTQRSLFNVGNTVFLRRSLKLLSKNLFMNLSRESNALIYTVFSVNVEINRFTLLGLLATPKFLNALSCNPSPP